MAKLSQKFVTLLSKAINSVIDQINERITARLPVTINKNTFVVAQGLVTFRSYIGVFLILSNEVRQIQMERT